MTEEFSRMLDYEPCEPASPRSQTELAYARLRARIFDFRLLPGVSLSERGLQEELALSRTPIRAALQRLAQEGLVQPSPRYRGRGYQVAPIVHREIEEAYALRILLEREAVRLAAARAGILELAPVDRLLAAAEGVEPPDQWLAVATDFHLAIARLSGNRFLADALERLLPRIMRARLLEVIEDRARAGDEHRRIWTLITSGDAETAQTLIGVHIERSKQRLLQALKYHARGLRAHGVEVAE